MFSRRLAALSLFLVAPIAQGGVTIVFDPPNPQLPSEGTGTVDVYLQEDTPGESGLLRFVQLDLSLTSPSLNPVLFDTGFADGGTGGDLFWDFSSKAGCLANNADCGNGHLIDSDLAGGPSGADRVSATYTGLTASTALQFDIPDDGSMLKIGTIQITCRSVAPGTTLDLPLDVVNADALDADAGAQVHWGFGSGAGDPITRWTIQNGMVSGGSVLVSCGDIPGGNLIAQDPACRRSLWRTKLNTIRLTFDADLSAVPGPGELTIAPMLAGGAVGAPLAGFTYAIENDGLGDPRVLRIDEPDPGVFTHQQWYKISNTGWADATAFDAIVAVVVGDADNSNSVTFTDINQILSSNGQGVPPAPARRDIDGSASVTFTDVNLALTRNGTGAVTEPTGHVCTVP